MLICTTTCVEAMKRITIHNGLYIYKRKKSNHFSFTIKNINKNVKNSIK